MFEENKDAEAAKNDFLQLMEATSIKKKNQDKKEIENSDKEYETANFLKGFLKGRREAKYMLASCTDCIQIQIQTDKIFEEITNYIGTAYYDDMWNRGGECFGTALGLYIGFVHELIKKPFIFNETLIYHILINSKKVPNRLQVEASYNKRVRVRQVKLSFIQSRLIQIAKKHLSPEKKKLIAQMAAQFA